MKRSSLPPPSDPERTAFDWAYHSGAVDRVRAKISARVVARTRRRRKLAGGAIAAVAVLMFFGWLVPLLRHTGAITTLAAQRSALTLADGTRAELNARTELKTDFRHGRRVVRLERGEAFFSVTHDTEHPFFVRTAAGAVRVLGTTFNVRLVDDGVAEITLLEGRISVEQAGVSAIEMAPNQQLTTGSPEPHVLDAPGIERATAWRRGQFVLDGFTLAEAARRFAAHHGQTITVDAAISDLHPGGSCPLDDLPGFLQALTDTLPIQVVRHADKSHHIRPRR